MKTKIVIFFVFVFCFCAFADEYADCQQHKDNALSYITRIQSASSSISTLASSIASAADPNQYSIAANAQNIQSHSSTISFHVGELSTYVSGIQCSSNNTCSVDLAPLAEVCSNIYDVVLSEYSVLTNCERHLFYIRSSVNDIDSALSPDNANSLVGSSSFSPDYWVNFKYPELLSAVSNFNNDVTISARTITNSLTNISSLLNSIRYSSIDQYGLLSEIDIYLSSMYPYLIDINNNLSSIEHYIGLISDSVYQYLPYLQTISDDLKSMYSLLSTNSAVSIDQAYTNMFRYSSLLGFDRFRYYAQGQLKNTQVSLYPLSPYDTLQNLRNATIYDAVAAGFESLLISQGSINNYLYWLQAVAGSNRLDVVDSHIMAISNMVYRLDDYVLNDFSNEIANISYSLSFVTNQVDYTTNLVEITNQLHTNNNHLASIDSKLDVLDYIKVLSDTPLSQFSGDSYYDYLTNLYLTGGSSSSLSTNWFERIEILLASLVFGDSVSSNISTDVEFSNFSEDNVRDAFNDYTFQNELNSGIDLVNNTGQNFLTILRGFHDALASVSQPQSIAIGIGGIDGGDTMTFDDAQHGHFQVSFGSGASDNFTLIVRSMTTIIWILFTMMFIYFSARWLLFKVLFFYRLMRTLITSLFLK